MKKILISATAAFLAVAMGMTLLVVMIGAAGGGATANIAALNAPEMEEVNCSSPVNNGSLVPGKVPASYVKAVESAARVSGMPAPYISAQIEAESGWNPKAVSGVGAQGIAQFMPATWGEYGNGKDPFDGVASIEAQGRFMKYLYDEAKASSYSGGPINLALAGFNAGWGGVQAAGGIPDNGETAQYVIKINKLAATYASDDGDLTVKTVTTTDTECNNSGGGTTSGVDDYPGKALPHCWLNGDGSYGGCPEGSISVFGAYNAECVDFVMWRLNQQLGTVKAPYAVTNSTFRGDGGVLGNAVTYLDAWNVKGWDYGNTPVVGAVAYYGAFTPYAPSEYGHVAIVKEILPDGSYIEEGYNYGRPPGDHQYYTITRKNSDPSKFLYLPGKGPKNA